MLEEVIHCKISKKDFFEFKLQNSSDGLITNEENSRLLLSSLGLADYKVCNSLRGENTYYSRVGRRDLHAESNCSARILLEQYFVSFKMRRILFEERKKKSKHNNIILSLN